MIAACLAEECENARVRAPGKVDKEQKVGDTFQKTFTFSTTCAAGLERLVAAELESFGGSNMVIATGAVLWQGPLACGYRCCLWSRFASRVFLELGRFTVENEESIYAAASSIDWSEHLAETTTFAVSCTLTGESPVGHSRYAALKFKDGLVDSCRRARGSRPSVKTSRPDVQLHVHVDGNMGTVALDLSGESLHRRGYRVETGTAPLKETLAAAIVAFSRWAEEPQALVDPMCGSATLLIEAALLFLDSAPGLSRSYFGFFGWRGHDRDTWQTLVEEALHREERGAQRLCPPILGYDCDPQAIRAARKNIARAGLEGVVVVSPQDVAQLRPPAAQGMLLTNLPYGERLSEKAVVTHLYRGYGRVVRHHFQGWRIGVFLSDPPSTDSFGLPWKQKYKLHNGPIHCRLLLGEVPREEEAVFRWPRSRPGDGGDGEFANRLRKNLSQRLRWAEREGVSCFRVYDRDLPDYNVSIDLYGKWVHIQEWAPPKTVDALLAKERFERAVIAVKELLQVRSDRVFLKTRERQKGRSQYEKKGDIGKMYEVQEGPCTFLVNFTDYLDTGLFLDHRPVRTKIFASARDRKFLNLFGYTGTASVHAALGGAKSTTTVDLSATYIEWARMNLAANGLGEVANRTERADCLSWLQGCRDTFDLIFVDPPTFSNTKKEKRVFDIQKDHRSLLTLAMSRLAPDGQLLFSTNFRRFMLDGELSHDYVVSDISVATLPIDFSRDQRVHQCWEFRHRR